MTTGRYWWLEYLKSSAGSTAKLSAVNGLSPVVALVGLGFEARIAAGEGVLVVCRGSGREPSEALHRALREGCRSIISFGVAGGLAPELRVGDVVVASAVRDAHTTRATDPIWSQKLLATVPHVRHGPVIGVNSAVLDPKAKRELYERTGAVTIDMESHLVAQEADAHNLAFAVVRVVVDPAHRVVPEAALMAIGPAGNIEIGPVLRQVLACPSQLSAFTRIALEVYVARSVLQRVRRIVGLSFGFPEPMDSTLFDEGFAP